MGFNGSAWLRDERKRIGLTSLILELMGAALVIGAALGALKAIF